MKCGWMFRTPTWGRWGNGYIFDDRHITAEQAKQEVEEYLGKEITVGNVIKFEPGRLEKVWIKNCVAIGLSASFVEPIEASSIGTTIQQSFMLMHKLINYNPTVIDKYNKSVTDVLENIRDFVCIHFINSRRDTEFWKDVANTKLPDSLQEELNLWKHRLPIKEDFTGRSTYQLFQEIHFLMIMHGLELFDVESIKNEYNSLDDRLKNMATSELERIENYINSSVSIPHKKMLELVREGVR
jgi:tryptophan halogenase